MPVSQVLWTQCNSLTLVTRPTHTPVWLARVP
ncbi:hypothetical protein F383_35232 [Gossypium arboreum]|uniref:Uncharacterized protein n=1 Tax=Gossypium arboreum TaxID=29729 RepID=A0A0B0N4M8_GOSAR|nr:hypothetical protein F383_34587 [Gossypium arboreum]KHG07770.1 hypothetical protein F383_35232 [Gossypium arboreum]